MNKTNQPPKAFLQFFRWFIDPDYLEDIEGDLLERHEMVVEQRGTTMANIRFALEVLKLLRPSLIRPLEGTQKLNQLGIMKNYFIISSRFMLKNKGYTFLNIGGLALGMFVAILIGLWLHDELTYNHYHSNYEDVAIVLRNTTYTNEVNTNYAQTTGLGTLLANEYGNHFKHVAMVRQRLEHRVLGNKETKFTQAGYFVQPDAPHIFSLNMVQGSRDGLKDMRSILLSKSTAKKLFGQQNPINQIVTMNNQWPLKVTGVYEDIPNNSKFADASYMATLDFYLEGWSHLNVWDNFNMWIFVQKHENSRFVDVSDAIKDAMLPHVSSNTYGNNPELFLHPMDQWHLNSEFENGKNITSARMKFVWFYSAIGVFVLILACINFVNLSTARSEKRAKEVGIRKAMGSHRHQLIKQFLLESFLMSSLAAILAISLVLTFLPWFNEVSAKALEIPVDNLTFWGMLIGFVSLTSLLSGTYPAFYLSSFNPVSALKNTFHAPGNQVTPRRLLVVFQFTVSIALIIGTLLMKKQIDHAKERPVGYSREGLIMLRPGSDEYFGKYHILRNELKNTGAVVEMAEANYEITSTLGWNHRFSWPDKPTGYDPAFNTIYVTHEYGKTVGWQFTEGRDFSRKVKADIQGVVINESAAKLMGVQNPVGMDLHYDQDWLENKNFTILGVVKDQIKGSPFENTHPAITFLTEDDKRWLFIRMNPTMSAKEAIPKIARAFNKVVPSAPFDFKFVDEEYGLKFQAEENIANLAGLFAILAICISCLGLLGLVAYVVDRRTKEIGIRKVLGAGIPQIWKLLSRDFLILVIIAGFIAIPITYYFITNWLVQYDYRIGLSWEVYVLAFLGAMILAVGTISANTLRIARMNPVKSLRDE